jgi:hypothetical protein
LSILTSRSPSEFWKIFDSHDIGVRQHPRNSVFSPDILVLNAQLSDARVAATKPFGGLLRCVNLVQSCHHHASQFTLA